MKVGCRSQGYQEQGTVSQGGCVCSGSGLMERLSKSSVIEKLWDMAVARNVRLTISAPASRAGPWSVACAFSDGDSVPREPGSFSRAGVGQRTPCPVSPSTGQVCLMSLLPALLTILLPETHLFPINNEHCRAEISSFTLNGFIAVYKGAALDG